MKLCLLVPISMIVTPILLTSCKNGPGALDVTKLVEVVGKAICDDVLEKIPNEPDYVLVSCTLIDQFGSDGKPVKIKVRVKRSTFLPPTVTSAAIVK